MQLPPAILGLICLAVIVIGIIRYIHDDKLMNAVTNRHRGTRAERRLVVDLQKAGIPASNIYHDLYLEYRKGYYSQIDVVAVIPSGIIVFEEKDYSGWLFGTGWQNKWTQVLNYGKEKHSFYNPIKQNQAHISHLRDVLNQAGVSAPMISCIVFYGGCEFKDVSDIPQNVALIYACQLSSLLKSLSSRPAVNANFGTIRRILRTAVRNGEDAEVQRRHLTNIAGWKARNNTV